MTQNPDPDKLKDLGQRLDKARGTGHEKTSKKKESGGNALGKAYKMAIELVVAIVIGGGIGWYLDKWLETGPWLFVIFFFLGVAAGFRNVYKAAQSMSQNASKEDKNRDN